MILNDDDIFVILSNPATRLLLEFIKHRNKAIDRVTLLKDIWEDYGFTASNSNLNTYVSELRKAFKALGESPQLILTIPKHGFQFVAYVESHMKAESQEKESSIDTQNTSSEKLKNLNFKREFNSDVGATPSIGKEDTYKNVEKMEFSAKILLMLVIFTLTITAFKIYYSCAEIIINKKSHVLAGRIGKCMLYVKKNSTYPATEQLINQVKNDLHQDEIDCKNDNNEIFYLKGSNDYKFNQLTFIGICAKKEGSDYPSCKTISINSGV
ncbi:transcriptional regulator [Yersinia sp. 1652 StPb PI]|uniref:winged helix-turn-helix domain-containing protein n=2 Tax=Yersinia TaxID=629 RepID=UPI00355AF15A